MDRPVALILNPVAGGGRAAHALADVEAALHARGIRFRTLKTMSLEHARGLAREALAAQEVVATLGGDGLVGAVAGVLQETDGVLAMLPGGRGNDLARVLGISRDPAEACEVLASGVEQALDVGDVDGRPFIGIASVGFDSEANRIANETTLVKGDLVYAYAAIRALVSWTPARFELELDGSRQLSFSGYSVAAANSKAYGGGMFVAPDAELDDGLLDVVLTGRGPKRRGLYNLPKVFSGRHADLPSVRIERAGRVRISADRPFTVYADGDPIGELPVTVSLRHRALRVLVPA